MKYLRILLSNIIPNCLAPIIVNTTMSIGGNIMMISALSFVGLGVQPPIPEWGAILNSGREYVSTFWPLITFPGIAIALTMFGFNVFGDGLRDALDLAFSYDRRVLVEQGLDHPIEVNCSVLGFDGERRASVLEMSNAGEGFLDFADKYLPNHGASKGMASSKHVIPAPVGEELTKTLQNLSMEIFDAMDCKSVVRIDYMIDRHSGKHYITEINTIPGSLAFYLWQPTGLPYAKLIDEMVSCALKAHQEKERNSFAFSSDILSGVQLGGKTGKLGGKMGGKL